MRTFYPTGAIGNRPSFLPANLQRHPHLLHCPPTPEPLSRFTGRATATATVAAAMMGRLSTAPSCVPSWPCKSWGFGGVTPLRPRREYRCAEAKEKTLWWRVWTIEQAGETVSSASESGGFSLTLLDLQRTQDFPSPVYCRRNQLLFPRYDP